MIGSYRRFILTLFGVLLSIHSAPLIGQQLAKRASALKTPPKLSAKEIFAASSSKVVLLKSLGSDEEPIGLASGVLLSFDGYIATNAHGVVGAVTIEVTVAKESFCSFRFPSATLRYYDAKTDLAILKLDPKTVTGEYSDTRSALLCHATAEVASKYGSVLPWFDITKSQLPEVGDPVYAIGNPRGLEQTFTDGIVSGVRLIDGVEMIQHSAPISPGSSGGALMDQGGVLVGINTFTLKDSQNLNFAIGVTAIAKALEMAKLSGRDLSFPDAPKRVTTTISPLDALTKGDYLQAIELAKAAFKLGEDSSSHYCVIGISYYLLGNLSEAETYLKQTLALVSADEKYKQTARFYLWIIRDKEYRAAPSLATRATLADAVREFLRGNALLIPTPLTRSDNESVRKWARDTWTWLNDISGEWRDSDNRRFIISKSGEHQYSIIMDIKSGQPSVRLSGTLTPIDGFFIGSLKHGVLFFPDRNIRGSNGTVGEQEVSVRLQLLQDTGVLSGTAVYSEMRAVGDAPWVLTQVFRPQTVQFTLRR